MTLGDDVAGRMGGADAPPPLGSPQLPWLPGPARPARDLELSDGTLSITRLSAAQYSGELAFLSACRTAAGGVDLPDEVITLAPALNYTGYRYVVATLWSVAPGVGTRTQMSRSAVVILVTVRACSARLSGRL